MRHCVNYQIGDWIMVEGKPIQIAAVHQKKVGYHKWPGRLSWVRLDQIQQIPLTPDFLLKNGFKREDNSYKWSISAGDGFYNVTLYDSLGGIWGMRIIGNSKFSDDSTRKDVTGKFLKVHQIQHEFVSEGIKKEFVV